MRRLSRFQNNLLTLGAVLGALCLAVAIAAVLTGAKPLVFRSGSMAPAIPTGALGISVPVDARSVLVGDVISVENGAGSRITHRVVKADVAGDVVAVRLKGDANAVADAAPYMLQETERVVAHAPLLGYAVAWLSSSAAVYAGGLFTAYLLYLAFGAPRRRQSGPGVPPTENRRRGGHRAARESRAARHTERPRRRATRVSAMAVSCVSVLTGSAVHTAAPSQAAFIDNATGTALYSARSLGAPTFTCKQATDAFLVVNPGEIDLSWIHNNGSLGTMGYKFSRQIGNNPATEEDLPATTTVRSVTAGNIDDASNIAAGTEVLVTFIVSSKYQNWVSPATVRARYKQGNGIFSPATLSCEVPPGG